jgi:hypothetical protein
MFTRSMPVLMCLFIGIAVSAENEEAALKGAYAGIDTAPDIRAIQALQTGSDEEKKQTAERIIKNSSKYTPSVFFYLADYLSSQKDADTAIFWLYAGRIRTRYDIARCADQTVEDSIDVLNSSISELLRLSQFENIEKTKELVRKAVEWYRKTPHDYDPKWIALHGMGPFLPDAEKATAESLTVSKDKWDSLAEENREKYWKAFLEDINTITPDQMKQIKKKLSQFR